MESNVCEYMPINDILPTNGRRITAMSSAVKKGLLALSIAGASLLPLQKTFAQTSSNVDAHPKTEQTNLMDANLKAGQYSKEHGIGFVVYKGQDVANVPHDKVDAYMRNTILKDVTVPYEVFYRDNYDTPKTVFVAYTDAHDLWGTMSKGELKQNLDDIQNAARHFLGKKGIILSYAGPTGP